MTAPSSPTNPGSHSRGLAYKQGTIVGVEGNIAHVRTTLTDTIPVRRDLMRAKGRLPEVGETWLLTREFGSWHFGLIVVGGDKSNEVPQEDVTGLVSRLDAFDNTLDSHEARLDNKDSQVDFLARYAYSWASLQELAAFGNSMQSLSLFSARDSVAVASAGRYINMGVFPAAYTVSAVRVYVTAAVVSSSIQMGLFRGPIDNLNLVAQGIIDSGSTGMKLGLWDNPTATVTGENLVVGMATSTPSTLAVAGFENAVITYSKTAQVAIIGATTLASSLVMGPTSSHTATQGRHWIGLF
jgi:hypothetical protein